MPAERLARLVPQLRRWLIPAAVAVLAVLCFAAMREILAQVRLRDIRAALHAIPDGRLALALLFTGGSYLALTGYDWLALRATGQPRPWRIAALASFCNYALGHNLGFAMFTGGSARVRIYGKAGLPLPAVARVIVAASATFWCGVSLIAGVALVMADTPLRLAGLAVLPGVQHPVGAALLAAIGSLFVLRAFGTPRLRFGRFSAALPPLPVLAGQFAVSTLDLLCASAALFVLVPGFAPGMFPAFFLAYALALVTGLVSHVPGGLGVFEAVVLALMPGDRGSVFAGLILYRAVYYLLPLLCAGILIGVLEGRHLRRSLRAGVGLVDKVAHVLAPTALALLVFAGGFVLLISGALPGEKHRLLDLAEWMPMPFTEASHFAASLAGTALVLIAPALRARLRSGFHAARLLLLGGALFSLVKGLDWEEAVVLLTIVGVLQYCKPAFSRRARILDTLIDNGWMVAAIAAIALSLWAGFFAYKHVPYSDDLWWRFAVHGNAPRFLRASLGAGVILVMALVRAMLFRPARARRPEPIDPALAERALAAARRSDAHLAFTGDKSFLASPEGDAFVMYRVRGRSWIVMGNPVGPAERWSALLWELKRQASAARGRLCVYQASGELLPILVDLGLQLMKYGEEAHVRLADFTLAGPRAKDLRYAVRKAEAADLRFAVLPAHEVPAHLAELRAISDAWLAGKRGREKRFSLGRFEPGYLSRFDCAVLMQGERCVAFANIWPTADRSEVSVDLMRHLDDLPPGAMDFLFVRLMGWAQSQGYAVFNLGVAPLSGIRGGAVAPLWAQIAHAVFRRGERLYRFAGLRAWKAKFAPDWTARYVAVTPGLAAIGAIIDLTQLISA